MSWKAGQLNDFQGSLIFSACVMRNEVFIHLVPISPHSAGPQEKVKLHSIHVLGGEIHKVHSEMIFQHAEGSTESGEQKLSLGIYSSKCLVARVLFLLKFMSTPPPQSEFKNCTKVISKLTLNYDYKFF